MRRGHTFAAVAAALTIAAVAWTAGPQPTSPGPDASAGQGAPGVVSENPGAHPSGRTRSQDGPGVDPGNNRIESGNTRFYSPRGVARPNETVTRGTVDSDEDSPQAGHGGPDGPNPGAR
jgi:hypothetical protein